MMSALKWLAIIGSALISGLALGTAAYCTAFGVVYAICRVIVSVAADEKHMFWMWLMVPVGFMAFTFGFIFGACLCAGLLYVRFSGSDAARGFGPIVINEAGPTTSSGDS